MVYPPWESLASASPRPNFPAEDKSHNLRIDVVDPIHHREVIHRKQGRRGWYGRYSFGLIISRHGYQLIFHVESEMVMDCMETRSSGSAKQ